MDQDTVLYIKNYFANKKKAFILQVKNIHNVEKKIKRKCGYLAKKKKLHSLHRGNVF